jgi:integrase
VGDPTVIKALGFLQGVMKRAVVRGKVVANPVCEVSKPRQHRSRRPVPLAPVTVEAIRARLAPRDATLESLMAYAGLRPGEALRVEVEHIGPKRLYVDATKTGHERHVDLLAPLAADLAAWQLRSGIRSGLMFRRADGVGFTETDYRNWRRRIYVPAAEAAGVTGDLRPYRLRGSFASLLLWEGRSITYVAEQDGHDIATLSRHYAGVLEALEGQPRVPAADAIAAARDEAVGSNLGRGRQA